MDQICIVFIFLFFLLLLTTDKDTNIHSNPSIHNQIVLPTLIRQGAVQWPKQGEYIPYKCEDDDKWHKMNDPATTCDTYSKGSSECFQDKNCFLSFVFPSRISTFLIIKNARSLFFGNHKTLLMQTHYIDSPNFVDAIIQITKGYKTFQKKLC